MTRSSTNELSTPFKEPEREFQSSRKQFKTLSLDESRSLDFDLFSGQEKYSEEEVAETMEVVLFYNGLDVPTRQILDSKGAIPSKTAADAKVAIQEMAEHSQNGTMEHLGPEVPTTPKIAHSRKKGKPSKKLTTLNLVHLFKEGDIEQLLWDSTIGTMQTLHTKNEEIRASTYAAIRNQGASIKTSEIQIGQMSKVLQERGFGSLPSSIETNPRDHVKSISTTFKADASSIRRIRSHQSAVSTGQNKAYSYGASHINKFIPPKEKDLGSFTLPCYINNVCFDNALADRGASVSVMPLSTYLNLGLGELAHTKLTVELVDRTVKYPKGIAENGLVGIGKIVFPIDFIILDMPEDIKVPLVLGRPFLSTAHAKIDVFKRKITLRVGEEKIIFKSVKPASSLIKRVYMLSLRERKELDLEARLTGETLLRRDQVDDLMPTIEEGEIVEEFRARNDARMVSEVFGYPSDCDHDKKIRIDCAHNLKFSFMIGPRCKEIDNVGEVFTIWKSRSVGVLKSQDGCSTHILAHKLNLENLPSKISGEFLILILLNSRF
ncbi:retrovirus-related pol polyprotein from transposon TNT 1-94 [Tanacetum coccineum]|uniref:Retrovirus-related pol polyprotein from transposon TNT 1-94 n=1 Tax=Tanacetum coccineum TaxID=301880 RepID=A0ABQ5H151_9ASTR